MECITFDHPEMYAIAYYFEKVLNPIAIDGNFAMLVTRDFMVLRTFGLLVFFLRPEACWCSKCYVSKLVVVNLTFSLY